ncbi:MAG: uroporphyrinogen-III synthase [Bacteroidetes bacterium HGW-Bacteroidetes-17]|nr:MAG: uroporphyrinogen-III synthase [Bacteroidetes bacterium HGW-Bacteroidetes-17]
MKIKNILVSQPKPLDLEKSPYGDLALKYKLNIEFYKFIKIEGIPAKDFRKDRVNIADHSAVIFTSRSAVDHFFRIAKELRIEVSDTMKYFCISESTAFYLQKYVQYRKRKIFHGKQNFADLIDIIRKHKGEKFLLPCSDIHKVSMSELLDSNEIDYTKAVIYKTVASNLSKLEIEKYDMLIFFSPSGIASLFKNFPNYQQNGAIIAAFGPTTSTAIINAGLRLDLAAPTKASPSMTMAIEEYILNESKKKK